MEWKLIDSDSMPIDGDLDLNIKVLGPELGALPRKQKLKGQGATASLANGN